MSWRACTTPKKSSQQPSPSSTSLDSSPAPLRGEGLGNKFLANIRQCDAIVHIVRAFESGDIVHVENDVNPRRDIETINAELILADLQTIDARLVRVQKEAKADPKAKLIYENLLALKEELRSRHPCQSE